MHRIPKHRESNSSITFTFDQIILYLTISALPVVWAGLTECEILAQFLEGWITYCSGGNWSLPILLCAAIMKWSLSPNFEFL